MKKKRKKQSNRERKPNRAVLSGIKPDQETCDEIRCRIIWGSSEWPMVALQNLIKNGSPLPSNYLSAPSDVRCSPYAQRPPGVYPLWNRLCFEFERAVLNADSYWFRRQADAIEKGGLPRRAQLRAQFNDKVVLLLEQAMSKTQGRPKNWRPLSHAEREALPEASANLQRVPQVITLTPAGKFTDETASDIWKALVDVALEEPETRLLIEQQLAAAERWKLRGGRHNEKQKRLNIERLAAEKYGFKTKELAIDAIRHLADKHLQFKLKKQLRKR